MTLEEMELRQLRAEVERLREEIVRWRSTGAEAAREIEDHWAAHCDESGAGPTNLVRRLRGRPDYYDARVKPNSSVTDWNYRDVARRIEGFED